MLQILQGASSGYLRPRSILGCIFGCRKLSEPVVAAILRCCCSRSTYDFREPNSILSYNSECRCWLSYQSPRKICEEALLRQGKLLGQRNLGWTHFSAQVSHQCTTKVMIGEKASEVFLDCHCGQLDQSIPFGEPLKSSMALPQWLRR